MVRNAEAPTAKATVTIAAANDGSDGDYEAEAANQGRRLLERGWNMRLRTFLTGVGANIASAGKGQNMDIRQSRGRTLSRECLE